MERVRVLVGGVGELFQGDLDLGRRAAERLIGEDLGRHVLVEDLYYGAIAVAQRLEDLRPRALVLVGSAVRGRAPGAVERRRVTAAVPPVNEFRRAMEAAGTGYVDIDLVLTVAAGLRALPARTVAIEAEPEATDPSDTLSPTAEAALEEALDLVRAEVRRIPVLELADEIRKLWPEGRIVAAPATEAMARLLRELERLDAEGRWGAAFSLKERVRLEIAEGRYSEGMTGLDWTHWWSLVEELDRLQALEVAGA